MEIGGVWWRLVYLVVPNILVGFSSFAHRSGVCGDPCLFCGAFPCILARVHRACNNREEPVSLKHDNNNKSWHIQVTWTHEGAECDPHHSESSLMAGRSSIERRLNVDQTNGRSVNFAIAILTLIAFFFYCRTTSSTTHSPPNDRITLFSFCFLLAPELIA